eukprot:CAMPEP_0114350374 /NCGR_PEP_ID=MMETSP0101-20121206/16309_1 /TAXON_ID=38822 ORGANISM="Pteridomonas danica, Strain PT" /NCGR_SAMPLE_ID=MMETSP0101 /ASSEMBLY_ACC=CAM_ASM_000211 /LENGTH=218 /DNA_ID=CAMNT_0001489565 /DNA_START=61 /DNA_END=717 /DNA_ORIENTATION=+
MKHFGIAYKDVEVSPLSKSQISWSKDYQKVPIAVFSDGKVVCDSSLIIQEVLDRQEQSTSIDLFISNEAKEWEKWSTEKLAILMYPNMTRSFSECRQLLSYYKNVEGIGFLDALIVQNIGAFGMTLAHGKIKEKYGLDDEREALWKVLDEFIEKLNEKGNNKFLGGDIPNLGDVSVYGVLSSAQGVPLFDQMISYGNGRLGTWMNMMNSRPQHSKKNK